MKKESLLQIGEIAKICDVSIQTLRYYDKIGFLKPDYIDEKTNYRYYSREHVFLLTNVKLLKSAGFSLLEIQDFIKKQSIREITQMYNNKIAELDLEINDLSKTKDRVKCYVDFLSTMLSMPEDKDFSETGKIKVVNLPDYKVAFIREKVRFDYPSLMFLYNRLVKILFDNDFRVERKVISVFHEGYTGIYKKEIDFELAHMVTNVCKINENIRIISGGDYLTCLHKGKYPSSIETYDKMKVWMDKNNYKAVSPVMHVLIVPIAAVKLPEETVFEMRIKVEKK